MRISIILACQSPYTKQLYSASYPYAVCLHMHMPTAFAAGTMLFMSWAHTHPLTDAAQSCFHASVANQLVDILLLPDRDRRGQLTMGPSMCLQQVQHSTAPPKAPPPPASPRTKSKEKLTTPKQKHSNAYTHRETLAERRYRTFSLEPSSAPGAAAELNLKLGGRVSLTSG